MEELRPISDWLPITKKELDKRGIDQLDVVIVSGDAYVDHPWAAAYFRERYESDSMEWQPIQ